MRPLPGILSGMNGPLLRKAAALALAAWLSFAVAASLHVQNAYWAAMPVWVLAQASRGLVLERAFYRLLGTLIGAAAGFVLLRLPMPPLAHLLALALWIALNAGLTHVLRGVLAYAALLAGMTTAIVVIPSVLTAAPSIELAMARVECTLIGVAVSTLVLAVLTPESPLGEFYGRIRSLSAEAVAYAAHVIGGDAAVSEERRILALISQMESTSRLTSAGSLEGYRRIGDVDRLVVGSLSAMAAAQAARGAGRAGDAALTARLEALAAHLRDHFERPVGDAARDLGAVGDPAVARLQAAIGQILDADAALRRPPVAARQSRTAQAIALAPHREWMLARRTGAMAGLSTLLAAALGLWLPWPPLQLAAMGVCIFVMVLGSLPAPQAIAPKLLLGVVAGVAAALLYRLLLQPTIASTGGLLLSLVPFLLLGALARVSQRFWVPAIDANMCFLLVSQAGMPASAEAGAVFADAIALTLAAATVAGGFLLLPRQATWQAADAAATLRSDLRRIVESAAASGAAELQARLSRQILRLTLHLGRAPDLAERWPAGLLAALNLGHAIVDLQQQGMPESVRSLLRECLRQERAPAATAQALSSLAEGCGDGRLQRALAGVAANLLNAAEVLGFDGKLATVHR